MILNYECSSIKCEIKFVMIIVVDICSAAKDSQSVRHS